MSDAFRLLVVDDNEGFLKACEDTLNVYKTKNGREAQITKCGTLDDVFSKLDNFFDGAIIDMKLAGEGDEGKQVIKKITDSNFRIPIAIVTATPSIVDNNSSYIGVFPKDQIDLPKLFDSFWEIYDTGLTRVMNGRGIIEKNLSKVFSESLLPQRDKWVALCKSTNDSSKTEEALLRYALVNLLQLLSKDGVCYLPEEFYLCPPLTNGIRSGRIVQEKKGTRKFVVLSPACDLVARTNGDCGVDETDSPQEGTADNLQCCNTDRILLVEIDPLSSVFPKLTVLSGLSKENKNQVTDAFRNKKSPYYHWLPETALFAGGLLNFRKLSTCSVDEFHNEFTVLGIEISPHFVKDMVARFSSYYGRQGQPEIDTDRYFPKT